MLAQGPTRYSVHPCTLTLNAAIAGQPWTACSVFLRCRCGLSSLQRSRQLALAYKCTVWLQLLRVWFVYYKEKLSCLVISGPCALILLPGTPLLYADYTFKLVSFLCSFSGGKTWCTGTPHCSYRYQRTATPVFQYTLSCFIM